MIPFPGESRSVDDAVVIDGGEDWTLSWDVSYRAWRFSPTAPGHRVMSSGEEWRSWVYPGSFLSYMEDGSEDVSVSWVVEVLSGTVTFSAAEGFDPAYGDTSLTPSTSLGSHTVTGPATLVIPSTFTGANVYGSDDALMLVLEATSGSADIQQVKLRVWPPGGALGTWSEPKPGFTTPPTLPTNIQAAVNRNGGSPVIALGATEEAAWDAASAAAIGMSGAGGPHAVTTTDADGSSGSVVWRQASPPIQTEISVNTHSPTGFEGSAITAGKIAVLSGQDASSVSPIDPALTNGVDYIYPPNEVLGDDAASALSLGSAVTEWENPTATVEVAPDSPAALTGPSVASESLSSAPVSGGFITVNLADGPAVAVQDDTDTTYTGVPLEATDTHVVVHLSHSIVVTANPWPGSLTGNTAVCIWGVAFGSGTPGPSFAPMKSYVSMPAFRVWDPDLVVEEPLRLMQRGDGLAMGSGRVFGVGTRQGSIRVFGSV